HRPARLRMALTRTGVHAPPRAVGIPRAVSARATPRSDLTPVPRISRIVTAQVAADISHGSEGENQFSGLLHERVEDVPALLFGGREHGSDDHEVVGVVLGTESAGDFLP